MFSLICDWINGWVNNREAGDLRRHRAQYDVTVMEFEDSNSTQKLYRTRRKASMVCPAPEKRNLYQTPPEEFKLPKCMCLIRTSLQEYKGILLPFGASMYISNYLPLMELISYKECSSQFSERNLVRLCVRSCLGTKRGTHAQTTNTRVSDDSNPADFVGKVVKSKFHFLYDQTDRVPRPTKSQSPTQNFTAEIDKINRQELKGFHKMHALPFSLHTGPSKHFQVIRWSRHDMESLSALLSLCTVCKGSPHVESGPVFCLLLGVSSGCARPITGQVTAVTWPVIGWP